FAARAGEGRVLVYEGLAFEDGAPRTRTVVEWLDKIGDTGSVLFVTPEVDAQIARATANAAHARVRSVGTLRTSDLLTHDTLIVRRDALDALAARARTEKAEVTA
ncbi:MAG: 50S ribosomal protein L4, partial [Chloroflexota bacterium]|nr:50S ribosomal protein L4 [Chloroflexota bacterium]